MTVIFCVIRPFQGTFQAFFLFDVEDTTPPQPTAIYGGYLLSKFFIFYFFIFYQEQLVGVNGLLGTLVLGGSYN